MRFNQTIYIVDHQAGKIVRKENPYSDIPRRFPCLKSHKLSFMPGQLFGSAFEKPYIEAMERSFG